MKTFDVLKVSTVLSVAPSCICTYEPNHSGGAHDQLLLKEELWAARQLLVVVCFDCTSLSMILAVVQLRHRQQQVNTNISVLLGVKISGNLSI